MNRFLLMLSFVVIESSTLASPSGTYELRAESSEDRGVYLPDGSRVHPCTDEEARELTRLAKALEIKWNQKKATVDNEEWSLRKNGEKVMIQRPRGTAPGRLTIVFWVDRRSSQGVMAYSHVDKNEKPVRGCSVFLVGRWRRR